MAIYLTESDVESLIDFDDAIELVRTGFQQMASGAASNSPRQRVRTRQVMLHSLTAASSELEAVGFKLYTTTKNGANFLTGVYDAAGTLTALVAANLLGQIRTGAASAVATDLLARADSTHVGLFGSGFQAETQLRAVTAVRPITDAVVYSRDAGRRSAFAKRMSETLGIDVRPASEPSEAVIDRDVICTATTSRTPVFDGSLLDDGVHLNLAGGNSLSRTEVDATVIRRADRIACDWVPQCLLEAGEFVEPLREGWLSERDLLELSDVLAGSARGRTSEAEVTLFKSVGIGLEDLMLTHEVARRARERNVGVELPF